MEEKKLVKVDYSVARGMAVLEGHDFNGNDVQVFIEIFTNNICRNDIHVRCLISKSIFYKDRESRDIHVYYDRFFNKSFLAINNLLYVEEDPTDHYSDIMETVMKVCGVLDLDELYLRDYEVKCLFFRPFRDENRSFGYEFSGDEWRVVNILIQEYEKKHGYGFED